MLIEVHRTSAYLYLDAVHLTPHTVIDNKELGADFIGFSSYKIMGPHCAALAAAPELLETIKNQKLLPSTDDVPERFEYMESALMELPKVKTFGHAKHRTPTIYFELAGIPSIDVYRHLATKKINAPASNFYALEISRALGLGDTGSVRAGLAPYSTREDVDRLVAALSEL